MLVLYDLPTGMPSDETIGMLPAPEDIRKRFKDAGFEIAEASKSPETLSVKKHGCVCYLIRQPGGGWAPSGPPYFVARGLECALEDQGYQKFWRHAGKRFPVRVSDLKNLHAFDQEVRECLGWKSLYNESLGTTSARSVYDRMTGRPDK
jgi:hypothetical protein